MTTSSYGQPLFPELTYCARCCMPQSNEGMDFDEMGICQACQSSEHKIRIDWTERQGELVKILDHYKSLGNDYDCIIPISGGKDSAFQLHVLTKIYGMRALAVTFSHTWFTETGKYNLQNCLDKFGVDHIMFSPSTDLVNKLARQSLFKIGDACWHCHSGVGAFPMQIAVKYKIPLMIWGESIAETSGRATHRNPVRKFDRDYFTKVSAKRYPDEMLNHEITAREMAPFRMPSVEAIEEVGVVGIHLGDFIFWDDERQMEFMRDTYGWREDKVEGTYKNYKSVECRMAGVHDYTKFLKRGFGRGTDHASVDVRAGLLTREEAFELAKKTDTERPPALDWYLKITGFSQQEFDDVMAQHRRDLNISALTDEKFSAAVEGYRQSKGK
jgi:N-acetyl sugar amidotransferase